MNTMKAEGTQIGHPMGNQRKHNGAPCKCTSGEVCENHKDVDTKIENRRDVRAVLGLPGPRGDPKRVLHEKPSSSTQGSKHEAVPWEHVSKPILAVSVAN